MVCWSIWPSRQRLRDTILIVAIWCDQFFTTFYQTKIHKVFLLFRIPQWRTIALWWLDEFLPCNWTAHAFSDTTIWIPFGESIHPPSKAKMDQTGASYRWSSSKNGVDFQVITITISIIRGIFRLSMTVPRLKRNNLQEIHIVHGKSCIETTQLGFYNIFQLNHELVVTSNYIISMA